MTSLSGLIARHLRLDEHQSFKVFTLCSDYIIGRVTAFKFQHELKRFLKNSELSAKEFRLALLIDKHTYLGTKLFLLNAAKRRKHTLLSFLYEAAYADIDDDDAKTLYRIWSGDSEFRHFIRGRTRQLQYIPTIEEIEYDLMTEIYPEVLKTVKSYTSRKLTFLIGSTNTTPEDFHSDIMLRVLQAYYLLCPTDKSTLHITNYLRRTAHNQVINIIKAYTTLKGGRLTRAGLLVTSENQFKGLEAPLEYEDLNEGNIPIQKLEVTLSVNELLNHYKDKHTEYKILLILMGMEDKGFTEFLRQKKIASLKEDNVDIQDRVSIAKYRQYLGEFLSYSEGKFNYLLQELKEALNKNTRCSNERTGTKVVVVKKQAAVKKQLRLEFQSWRRINLRYEES